MNFNVQIHPNIDQTDYIFYGLVKTRNFFEAVPATLITCLIFYKALFFVMVTLRLAITIVMALLVLILFCSGINDKSVLTALTDMYFFHKRKNVVTLGVPLPVLEKAQRRLIFSKRKAEGDNAETNENEIEVENESEVIEND